MLGKEGVGGDLVFRFFLSSSRFNDSEATFIGGQVGLVDQLLLLPLQQPVLAAVSSLNQLTL